jgi:hypothetical protein
MAEMTKNGRNEIERDFWMGKRYLDGTILYLSELPRPQGGAS